MQIQYEAQAAKSLRKLPANVRNRIRSKIEQYAQDPTSLANNVIQLTNSDLFRLRVGDHRVIFAIESGIVTIMVVIDVRPRGAAYD
ncbi:type II toxin-antitoxin system RelE/ParE family toxin [Skermanella rosea]|uniref:type II toxin-antitoxin system RelE family toxin n=1 Tax=Skermanella rosea TaxID=1817965 RepID=UPI00193316F5|nr:type II toxin-antitoxin system RelE/ParE family toxin [Skermanella rosea]UEM01875.1 type II toxin-antitoxin system RelE/ParE family toxin [Skermanella rosea]